ncbi:MAG TPA: glycosyltransferase family 2 protein, partial [Draconibacterium sp.]|nr:glycosyltransferase family 2 protein [Draconibacterium sp.]
ITYKMEGFSVIMPTFNQAAFIRRAILSLLQQTFTQWELIIINDGCTDETEEFISDFLLSNSNITYTKNKTNLGLGQSINKGLDIARYSYIAYLPSDDYFHYNHLETFYKKFQKAEDAVLVFSGMNYAESDSYAYSSKTQTFGIRKNYCLQLVQTAHKKTNDRWVQRDEYITANLFDMYWRKLAGKGLFYSIDKITCRWTNHKEQRHKILSEDYNGGLNDFRRYYQIKHPLKIKVSKFKFIDEEELYAPLTSRTIKIENPLKILLVGGLSYHAERITAFEEQGHKLYGLWVNKGFLSSFDTVGPLPFGNVEDISYENRKNEIAKIKPDIIYALLNTVSVSFAYQIMKENPDIPFVWHFKESPAYCLERNSWKELIKLYHFADGKIYINEEAKLWFELFIPSNGLSYILNGDMPKKNHFSNNFTPRLSNNDNAIHTMIAGRMIGITSDNIKRLAENNIHIHFYNESYHNRYENIVRRSMKVAPEHFHIHPHCKQTEWVKEFSKYDAGWLHCFNSTNYGNVINANYDDINIPARIGTLAAAGIPMIQKNNFSHIVGMQSIVKNYNMGIFFKDYEDLVTQLRNKKLMNELRENVIKHREKFTFDYHVPNLIDFFRKVIETKRNHSNKS